MIRKPTRIELKQEDDYGEYEEYKKKQAEQNKKMTAEQSSSKMKNNTDKFFSDFSQLGRNHPQSNAKPQDLNMPMNLFFNNQARDLQSDIGSSNFLNSIFRNNQQPGLSQDQVNFDMGSEAITNNFIFSVLLNNISQSEGNTNLGGLMNSNNNGRPGMGPGSNQNQQQ